MIGAWAFPSTEVRGLLPGVPPIAIPQTVSCVYVRAQRFADGGIVESTAQLGATCCVYGEAARRIAVAYGLARESARPEVDAYVAQSLANDPEAQGVVDQDPWDYPDDVLLEAALVGLYRNIGQMLDPNTPPTQIEPWSTVKARHRQISEFAGLLEEVTA
jgi:hypothetical protein